jgi:hypothetical protein
MVERKAPSWEEKFEEKMKKLEKRIEEMGKTLEEKGEEFGKRVEDRAKTINKEIRHRSHVGHSLFWGIVLLVVGFLWLGNNLRWFWYDIPWIPVAMIAGGIFLIIKHWEKEPSKSEKSKEKA